MKQFVTLLWTLLLALAATGNLFAQVERNTHTLYIIKTKSLPSINDVVTAIKNNNPDQLIVKEYDLDGKLERGNKIVESIKKQITIPENVTVLTLGLPATQLAVDELGDLRIFYTMADSNKLILPSAKNIYKIPDKPSIADQLQILEQLLPAVKIVGIIVDIEQVNGIKKEIDLARSSSELRVQLKTINSPKEVPSVLRKFLPKIDAMIFVQDAKVINRDSYRYLVTTALENGTPTLVYSSYLVKAGFLGAYLPTAEDIARQITTLLGELTQNEYLQTGENLNQRQLILELNANTLQILGIQVPATIANITRQY